MPSKPLNPGQTWTVSIESRSDHPWSLRTCIPNKSPRDTMPLDAESHSENQYWMYRASLRAHLVKNPPAMQETPVQFLGREDPLEKG